MEKHLSSIDFQLCYEPVDTIEELFFQNVKLVKQRKNKEVINYYNISTAFDIEATSFYENEEKRACMYAFVLGVNGRYIFGRTWNEFLIYINKLALMYGTSYEKRLIIWIQNFSYEFQWIRKMFNWVKIFSLDERDPLYALTDNGIEFRCSYHLSNKSLASMGEDLLKYKIDKLIGDLDYNLIRHNKTPLSTKEWNYIRNDGLVLMAYIQEKIEIDGDITKIPLTNTGYVRKYCRDMCFYNGIKSHKDKECKKYYKEYKTIMDVLKITSISEYKALKRAFQGGYTHSNAIYNGITTDNVYSFDFTSSYPTVMVAEPHFPMSRAELVTIKSKEDFEYNLKYYCCLFDITFYDLDSTFVFDNYISKSKCWEIEDFIIDNGRIQKAKKLSITITDVDFEIIKKTYKWNSIVIKNFRRYKKGYLPKQLRKAILKLYEDKTILKDVEGEEVNYMIVKGMLNAVYGCSVTDPVRDTILYENDEWNSEEGDSETLLQKYNESRSRFLFYPWGIWVTALARRNLWTGILECGEDYIYCDTDSIKFVNIDKHLEYFNKYNSNIIIKLEKSMKNIGISLNTFRPKNKKGEEKTLGIWDYEGKIINGVYIPTYLKFKTLGAKRYMYYYYNKKDELVYNLTVSGVNKKTAIPYLEKMGDPLKLFDFGLIIPATYTYEEEDGTLSELVATGKNIHTYIDDEHKGTLIDYLGNKGDYKELSSVHLEPTSYEMSASADFINYIKGIKERFM